MANELVIHYPPGSTLYAQRFDATGNIWNGSAHVEPNSANWLDYDIAMSEVATATGIYRASMPAAAAGVYGWVVRKQAGGTPAVGDIVVGTGRIEWSGTAEVALTSRATQASVDIVNANVDAIKLVTDAIDTSAVTVTASNDAGVLTLIQAVTFNATVSGLTISATWAKLYFTLKYSEYDDDPDAIVQIVETNPAAALTDGLLYIDGAAIVAPITIADGTLTVSQAAGTVVIAITDNATALLAKASDLVWDIKTKDAAGNTVQNTTGTASILRAVTQTI